MREGITVEVSAADRARLRAVVADRNSPQKHVWRAEIILATADGLGTSEIMRRTGVSKPCVWRWQERFMREGVAGLLRDKTRPSRIPPLPQAVIDRVVGLTTTDPPHEATHWTAAAMAEAVGVSLSSVQRIWRAHRLRPHQVRTFKLSKDPRFAAKLRDIVGLYVNPPAHAVVLSVDEKPQIQALDRTQPGLPMKKGRCGTMTHDYERHGTCLVPGSRGASLTREGEDALWHQVFTVQPERRREFEPSSKGRKRRPAPSPPATA
jgi:transposase